VLVDVKGGANLIELPLDKLLQQAAADAAAHPSAPAAPAAPAAPGAPGAAPAPASDAAQGADSRARDGRSRDREGR